MWGGIAMSHTASTDFSWLLADHPDASYPTWSFGRYAPAAFTQYLRLFQPAQLASMKDSYREVSWSEVAVALNLQLSKSVQFSSMESAKAVPGYQHLVAPVPDFPSEEWKSRLVAALGPVSLSGECGVIFDGSREHLVSNSVAREALEFHKLSYRGGYIALDRVVQLQAFPFYLWAADRSWLLVTPPDMNSSLLGCNREMMSNLEAAGVEMMAVDASDPVLG